MWACECERHVNVRCSRYEAMAPIASASSGDVEESRRTPRASTMMRSDGRRGGGASGCDCSTAGSGPEDSSPVSFMVE